MSFLQQERGRTKVKLADNQYLRLNPVMLAARFLTKNEFSYCTDCYQRIFTKNCDAADSGSEKNHQQKEPLKCIVCEVRLEAGEAEGLLCAQCARPALCWQCGETMRDRELGVRRRDRAWHQSCLQCSHCHSLLAGLSFSWREDSEGARHPKIPAESPMWSAGGPLPQ